MISSPQVRSALILFVAVFAGASCSTAPPAAPPTQPVRSAAPARAAKSAPAELVPVRLDALDASRREPAESARNPFRFQPKVVAAPPRPVTTPATRPPDVRPVMPTVPAGPPPLPAIPLKYIGVVERANGVKWAVLSDGKLQLYGREGDIIDGQYRIVTIGADSIELAYADGRGKQTVKLTGQ